MQNLSRKESKVLVKGSAPSIESSLGSKLELNVSKMVHTLQMPHECLVIAWIYICRAVNKMQTKGFFLSNATTEK